MKEHIIMRTSPKKILIWIHRGFFRISFKLLNFAAILALTSS